MSETREIPDYDLPVLTDWPDDRLHALYITAAVEKERRQAAADARYDPTRPPGEPDWPQAD